MQQLISVKFILLTQHYNKSKDKIHYECLIYVNIENLFMEKAVNKQDIAHYQLSYTHTHEHTHAHT